MPPEQCPACGRFLKQALVAGLVVAPAPCPGCAAELTAAMFATVSLPDGDAGDPAPEVEPSDASVRPPDLAPDAVRGDEPRDVLQGWDVGVDAAEVAAWRDDRRPFPTDTVVVAGAGAAGALVGAATARDRSVRGALLGAVGGLLLASIARQVWRLQE